MKKIYIIQMSTKTIPARLISLFTMSKYSHVAISLNKNCDVTYSFGRRNICSILNSGFVVEHKNGKFFKKFNDTKCRIYELNVTDKQYSDLVKIIKHMEKYSKNYNYDYLGIILRYLKIPVSFKNKYVCSYFVAELLKEAHIYDFEKQTFFVRPKDFSKFDGFHLIYTGKYAYYR